MRPCRRFTQPERNRRRLTMRILDPHLPLLDPQHTPRSVSELKDIALQTLDRKVFIDRADNEIARLEYDCIIRGVGNRAAGSYRSQPRASTTAQTLIHRIVMEIRRSPPSFRAESFSQHPHD